MELNGIARRALLVSLNIGHWGSAKTDQEATKMVHQNKNALSTAGRYVKNLIDPAALKGIRTAQNNLREFHYTNTMPWSDSGWRLLPTSNYFDYSNGIQERQRLIDHEVKLFIRRYDELRDQAVDRLGELFHVEEYPDKEDLEQRYYTRISRRPMPQGDDLRLNISADQEAGLREEINGEVKHAVAEAMKDPWRRIADTLGRTIDSFNRYGEAEQGSNRTRTFRDSAVENIRELCDLLPRLNLTEDPELNKTVELMRQKLDGVRPDDLRQNDAFRAQMTSDLEEIRKLAACAL